MNRALSSGLASLLPLIVLACAPAPKQLSAPALSDRTLAQLAALDEAERVALRREAHDLVAGAHGASSIYDTAHFQGCPTVSEVEMLAEIDAVANDLDAEAAQAALVQAHKAIGVLKSDIAARHFRDDSAVSQAIELEAASSQGSDPEIAELLRRAAVDQYLRGVTAPVLLGEEPANPEVVRSVFLRLKWPVVCESDASNAAWLKSALTRRTWFLTSTDGEPAAGAAWALAQHADAFPDLQQTVLERIEPLVQSGEVIASRYAYLYDRVSLAMNGRQRFGTQMYCAGPGDWRPRPLEKPEEVDRLRREVRLPPMAEYAAHGARFCTASDEDVFG